MLPCYIFYYLVHWRIRLNFKCEWRLCTYPFPPVWSNYDMLCNEMQWHDGVQAAGSSQSLSYQVSCWARSAEVLLNWEQAVWQSVRPDHILPTASSEESRVWASSYRACPTTRITSWQRVSILCWHFPCWFDARHVVSASSNNYYF